MVVCIDAELESGVLGNVVLEYFGYIIVEYIRLRTAMHGYNRLFEFILPFFPLALDKVEIRDRL